MKKTIITLTFLTIIGTSLIVNAAPNNKEISNDGYSVAFSYPTDSMREQWSFKTEGNKQYIRKRYYQNNAWGEWSKPVLYRKLQ